MTRGSRPLQCATTLPSEWLEAQRAEIVRLRNAGLISNEIMHRVERERLEI